MWAYVVLYFIVGFAFLLIGQMLNHKGLDELGLFEPENDMSVFRIIATVAVLCWPVFAIFYTIVLLIPWLILSVYKLFVGIIFGTIALLKSEKKNE